tara:strand:- start:3 stop:317 length:315 start_codon:yes stop_codon:yes gene_type:complete
MGLLAIFIVLIVAFLLLEVFKHNITKNMFKYFVAFIIFIVILMVVSAFIDLGTFFDKDNTFAKTGAVIVEDVSEDIESIDWANLETLETIEEKTKEFLRDLLER